MIGAPYPSSDETWITPLFRYRADTTGWQANLFPIFHMGRNNQSTHLVVAPFVWDFATSTSRATVILPGFFRFMTRGLGTRETASPDILSLLMFQENYLGRLIELGEADADARADEIAEFVSTNY